STRTVPNAVAQNKNTTAAADQTAGASAGSVTVHHTRHGEAPRLAAASAWRGASDSQRTPTVRTTTAILKNTSAAMNAAKVPSRPSQPSQPEGRNRVRKATPTTTVGSTKGTNTSARNTPAPRKRRR